MSTNYPTYCEACSSPLAPGSAACSNCGHTVMTEAASADDFFTTEEHYELSPRREFNPEEIVAWLRRQLGPSIEKRRAPSLARWLSAVGGALVAIGGVALSESLVSDSGSTTGASFVIALVLAAGVAALAAPPRQFVPAAVAMTMVAAPSLGISVIIGSDDPSGPLAAFIAIAILGVLYFVGPSRGHSAHLGGFAAAIVAGGLTVAGADAGDLDFEGFTTSIAVVGIALAAVFLVLAYWLDGYQLKGMATPLYLVGSIALVIGLSALVGKSDVAAGIVGLLIAAAVLVGAIDRRRRAMVWFGSFGVLVAVMIFGIAVAPEDSDVTLGVLVGVIGAAIVLLSTVAERAVENFHATRTWSASPPQHHE